MGGKCCKPMDNVSTQELINAPEEPVVTIGTYLLSNAVRNLLKSK
jgi:hypothetical protein